MWLWLLAVGCDPYAGWPEQAFPAVYTPETDLPAYAAVRWETETWDPSSDQATAALYLLKAANHRPSAPVEVLDHFAAMRPTLPTAQGERTLSFLGDAMWITDNYAHVSDEVASLLDGDLRIGNLETPTSPDHPTDAGALGLYAFNAPPSLLDGLPLDVVQVNNNHSVDADDAGLEATLQELASRDFVATGVDSHAIVDGVAVLSYTWGVNRRTYDSAFDLFIVPFGHLDPDLDLTRVASDIAAARAEGAEVIVLTLHWGFEYEYYPDPYFLQVARDLIALGADLIVGQGPHVAQPAELCSVNDPDAVPGIGTCSVRTDDGEPRTAAVLYSLGNFHSEMRTTPCEVGLVATVHLDGRDVVGLGWTAVANQAAGGHHLVPLDSLDGDEWTEESARLDAHLGAHWRR